ncbi:YbaB/EbfC family nucleoid-associated protein [Phytomonospora sp. NPDC050363]|uniref:YbaB/EbfC family nucleoid-associated protein n=1 Tax=Phytomonospora sp. NPDC050363 TaxID=3155642 RepID=UPI0033EB7018
MADDRSDDVRDDALDLFAELRAFGLEAETPLGTAVEKMSAILFKTDAEDGTVKVHMTATGSLTRVEFRNHAFRRHDEQSLALTLVETIRKAEDVARVAAGFVRGNER